MNKTIIKLAKLFNESNITWAQGGLSLLESYNIIDEQQVIDIIISLESYEKAISILRQVAQEIKVENEDMYTTKHFHQFQLEDYEIHVMCELGVSNNGVIHYHFTNDEVKSNTVIEDTKIPNTHIIDWYVIFRLINNEYITAQIEKYYLEGNFINTKRLRELENVISHNVYNEVCESLSSIREISSI